MSWLSFLFGVFVAAPIAMLIGFGLGWDAAMHFMHERTSLKASAEQLGVRDFRPSAKVTQIKVLRG